MSKIGIFYGSTTGNTERVAGLIAEALQVPESQVHSVEDIDNTLISNYENLVLGSSTWGDGELQDDWYDALDTLKEMDLSGHKIALFGCGDSSSYPDTFCNAIGLIHEGLKDTGATFVGQLPVEGYTFDDSAAVEGDKFMGLAIDEDNEDNMTEERIAAWVKLID